MSKKNKQNKKGLSIVSVESLCDDYIMDWLEGERNEKIGALQKLKTSQGTVVKNSRMNSYFERDLDYFNAEIKCYQNAGLDLDKGNAEFGYKIPLPKPGENYRELIIFRRR